MHNRCHGGGGRRVDWHGESRVEGATERVGQLRLRHLAGHHFLDQFLLEAEIHQLLCAEAPFVITMSIFKVRNIADSAAFPMVDWQMAVSSKATRMILLKFEMLLQRKCPKVKIYKKYTITSNCHKCKVCMIHKIF